MKHILSILLIAFLTIGCTMSHAPQSEAAISGQTTRFADGSYCKETLTIQNSGISTFSTTTKKTATKTVSYYNSSNVLCWRYDLTATFQIKSGQSATCTSCSDTAYIYLASWNFVSKSTSKSGNKATGTVKMKLNSNTATKTLTLTCNKNGVIS